MFPQNIQHDVGQVEKVYRIAKWFERVDGWMEPPMGYALMRLASDGPGTGHVVEVGSFKGLSTCWLALGNNRGSVYAVDTFMGSVEHRAGERYEVKQIAEGKSTFPEFEKNLRGMMLWDRVRPICSGSIEAAKAWSVGAIRFLFIDAGHDYKDVEGDYNAWKVHLEDGAIVAFHDVGDFPGVTMFYEDLMRTGEHNELVSVGSLRAIQRKTE